jgi:hypothetical protein
MLKVRKVFHARLYPIWVFEKVTADRVSSGKNFATVPKYSQNSPKALKKLLAKFIAIYIYKQNVTEASSNNHLHGQQTSLVAEA